MVRDPSYQVRRALWVAYGVLALGLLFFLIGLYLIRQYRPTAIAPPPPVVTSPAPSQTPAAAPSPSQEAQPTLEPGGAATPTTPATGQARLSSTGGSSNGAAAGGKCRMQSGSQPSGQNANAIVVPVPSLPAATPKIPPLPRASI
jgi:hypothetical protein